MKKEERQEEKKPTFWEATDPHPPIIFSGKGENHRVH
jgi:hypothetical protein